jgi:hypothetical protein
MHRLPSTALFPKHLRNNRIDPQPRRLPIQVALVKHGFRRELSAVNYPYMDLIELMAAFGIALATRQDAGEITGADADLQFAEMKARIKGEIAQRDALRAQQAVAQKQANAQWMASYGQLLQGYAAWQQQPPGQQPLQRKNTPITCFQTTVGVTCW